MQTEKVTSIKSVLHDLSLIVPQQHWDDYKFYEWAVAASRLIRTYNSYDKKVTLIKVKDHKFTLPSDLVYIQQIAVYRGDVPENMDEDKLKSYLNLPEGFDPSILFKQKSIPWEPALPSTTPFTQSILCVDNMFTPNTLDGDCDPVYEIYSNLDGVITVDNGILLVSYLAYKKDENGDILIPDLQIYKEAIESYCLMRYWMNRSMTHEANAFNMLNFYRNMWTLYKAKAQSTANEPDLGQLENIRREKVRLKARGHFKDLFGSLNQLD